MGDNKWFQEEFINREHKTSHRDYEEELFFYQAIKNGDVDYIDGVCSVERFEEIPGVGVLSDNLMKNVSYHYVISVALTTRACVAGGLPVEEAFCLSDYYIHLLDDCKTTLDINQLNYRMCMDFTKRVEICRKRNYYSKPIHKCINYIYNHLHEKILVSELAGYVKLNKSYLSSLFKTEVGITIQKYIMLQKIKVAEDMLMYSTFSCNEIAHNLAFASQSHFTNIFKSIMGITPKEYRESSIGQKIGLRDCAIIGIDLK